MISNLSLIAKKMARDLPDCNQVELSLVEPSPGYDVLAHMFGDLRYFS